MREDDISFNVTVYRHVNGSGYMFEIASKLLANGISKSNIHKFDIRNIGPGLFLLKPNNATGLKPYLSDRRVRFYLKNPELAGIKHAKLYIKPKDFGWRHIDFGFLDSDEIKMLLKEKPSVWVNGQIRSNKKGVCLNFSGVPYLKNHHAAVLFKENNKIFIRRVEKNKYIKISKNNMFKKISNAKNNRVDISITNLTEAFSQKVHIALFEKDWSKFDVRTFFLYNEEKTLAKKLYENSLILLSAPNTEFDISIVDSNCKIKSVIEITTTTPQGYKKCGRFSASGSRITSKIQSARLWSIKNNKPSFVIIRTIWKDYGWIKELTEMAREDKCYVIFSNFNKYWEELSYRKIKNIV